MPLPAWYQDPTGRHEYRWWSGDAWTQHVSDRGVASVESPVAAARPRSSRSLTLVVIGALVLAGLAIVRANRDDERAVVTPSQPGAGELVPGEFTPAVTEVVGPSGGTVVLPSAGTPVDGVEVSVPAGAFPTDRTVSISWAPLSGTDSTGLVTPLSPLLRLADGGAYADDVVSVTVPVTVPVGWVAMGFYRDPVDGTLEGMPLLRADASAVTVGSRHFSEFFIAGVVEALISGEVRTGFDPVVDMWQFPNLGTTEAAGGHCAGMALTAMWFFTEQKDSCGCTLRGRYDNDQAFVVGPDTPDLWVDDARGLQWVTTVQRDVRWAGNSYYDAAWLAMYQAQPAVQFDAFRFSMAVTGEPQFVLLSTPTGKPAHAMIAYGAVGDQLLISDPNTPNKNPDSITFDRAAGAFRPFVSGVTADAPTITFANIGYAAKSALLEWNSIGTRFAEAEAGTIGMDRFAGYDVMAVELDEFGMEVHNLLTADYVPQRNPLPVYATSLGRSARVRATFHPVLSAAPGPVAEVVIDATSTVPTTGTYAMLDTTLGATTYGVLIEEWVVIGTDAAGNPLNDWRWAAFIRFGLGQPAPPVPVPVDSTPVPPAPPPASTVDCDTPPAGVPASRLNSEYMAWWLQCHDINDPFP